MTDLFAVLGLSALVVIGGVGWFGGEFDRQMARAERPRVVAVADALWRAEYMYPGPVLSTGCVDEALLDESMIGYYGVACVVALSGNPGWRMHAMLDCAVAHADMALSTERVVGLLDDRWQLLLAPGRLAGELVHVATGVRRDWRAPRTVAGIAEVIREEVNFPTQRYGEVFAETLLGGGVEGSVFRPLTSCVEERV